MPRRPTKKDGPPRSTRDTRSDRKSANVLPLPRTTTSPDQEDDDMMAPPLPGPSRQSAVAYNAGASTSQEYHQRAPIAAAFASDARYEAGSSSSVQQPPPGLAYPNAFPPLSASSAGYYPSSSGPRLPTQHHFPSASVQQRDPSSSSVYRSSGGPSGSHGRDITASSSRIGGREGSQWFDGPNLPPLTGVRIGSAGPSTSRDPHTRLPSITTLLYSNDHTPQYVPPSVLGKRVSIPDLLNEPATGSTESPLQPITPASARSLPPPSTSKTPLQPHDPFARQAGLRSSLQATIIEAPTTRIAESEDEQRMSTSSLGGQPRRSTHAKVSAPRSTNRTDPADDRPTTPPRLPRNVPPAPWHRVEYDEDYLNHVQNALAATVNRFRQPTESFPAPNSSLGLRFQILDILYHLYFSAVSEDVEMRGSTPVASTSSSTTRPSVKTEPDPIADHRRLHRREALPSASYPREEMVKWLATLLYLPPRTEVHDTTPLAVFEDQGYRYSPAHRKPPHELLNQPLLIWCLDLLIRGQLSDGVLGCVVVYLVLLEPAIREALWRAPQTFASARVSPLSSCQVALITCCSLASKFVEEKCCSLTAWSRVTTLPLQQLLECEQQICTALEWNAWPLSLIKERLGFRLANRERAVPELPFERVPRRDIGGRMSSAGVGWESDGDEG